MTLGVEAVDIHLRQMQLMGGDVSGDAKPGGLGLGDQVEPGAAVGGSPLPRVEPLAECFAQTPADLTVTYEWSKDLLTYHAAGATDGEGTTATFSTSTDAGVTTVTATLSGGPVPARLFVRVRVTQN